MRIRIRRSGQGVLPKATQAELVQIMGDSAKTRMFIADVGRAIGFYQAFIKNTESDATGTYTRARLKTIARTPRRFATAMLANKFDPGLLLEGYALIGKLVGLDHLQCLAAEIRNREISADSLEQLAAAAAAYVGAVGPISRGRPADVPAILMVREIAASFEKYTGRQAGTGRRTIFTRVMTEIFQVAGIDLLGARQKLGTAYPEDKDDACRQKLMSAMGEKKLAI